MPYKTKQDKLLCVYKIRKRNRDFINNYLKSHPCKCGFNDIRALDFDHVDKTKKKRNVGDMLAGTPSISSLQKEIEKCQVLCANCHRIKTIENGDHLNKRNTRRII